VRRACIDIGSNTTRLLVAECAEDRLMAVHQARAFTRIGRGLEPDGSISAAKIAEVAEVVSQQLKVARALGAEQVRAVATAAIRHAANGAVLAEAIEQRCGIAVEILSGDAEARLAFLGAARTLGHAPAGELGVVDVGGGSSELVVGTVPDAVRWSASFAVGSGDLADRWFHSDPPSADELAAAQAEVRGVLNGIDVPRPAEAVAVGGSATSLHRLAGPVLGHDAFTRTLGLLTGEPAADIARRFSLDLDRVRLLPAGIVILQAASELFGCTLQIGSGGVREGVLLETRL
jgi:exopolyphosphatase / guanosine-5'-triphosphate,3'-diphosphate pyrophosphatase